MKIRGSRRAENRESEPQPDASPPPCPDWLTTEAQQVWACIAPQLIEMGVLTRIDGNAFARYCQMFADWRAAEAFLQKYGRSYPIKNSDGSVKCFVQFPEVAIARQLSHALTRLEAEFGMTPASRAGVTVTPSAGPRSALEDFLTKNA